MTVKIKTDKPDRVRLTLGLPDHVDALLRKLAKMESRSLTGEVSHLVVERARQMGLDLSGHVSKESGD